MSRSMGHPMTVVKRAQELVEIGWSAEATSRILADEGVTVTPRTNLRWTNPAQAERDRKRSLAIHRRNTRTQSVFRLRGTTPEYRDEFIRRLDAASVPATSIAKVCSILFDKPMSRHQVTY